MDQNKRQLIKQDFEKFMRARLRNSLPMDLETFVDFGASLLNFYIGSNLLLPTDKKMAASHLSTLFNAGLKHKINAEDLQQIVLILVEDQTLDYQSLRPIF